MSDWNPQVVRIEKVEKHAGADTLSVVITSIGDYPIITKLGEYVVGDLAVYIPIDTTVPDTEEFHFLSPLKFENYEEDGEVKKRPIGRKYEVGNVPESYRLIKAKKIRGQYSQGMLTHVPQKVYDAFFASLPDGELSKWLAQNIPADLGGSDYSADLIGFSVASILGFYKWEEDEEEASDPSAKGNKKKSFTQNEKKPDGWTIPYYDINSIRKFVASLLEGEEIVLTEKIHGANGGWCHDGEKLWCKSRNHYKRGEFEVPIRDPETGTITGSQTVQSTDQWWEVARLYEFENKMAQYPGLVFFGEVYGQVKGFRYDAEIVDGHLQPRVRFFDIWDTKTMRYLDYDQFQQICIELGLDMAPELYRGPWLGRNQMYSYAEGKTTLGGKHIREGFVLRTAKERFAERLNGRMQVKLVGEGYNLQK